MRRRGSRWGWLVAAAALVPPVSGCCRKPPQSIMDVNLAFGRAKDACATVYAPQDLAAIQLGIDEMNLLADAGKCTRAARIAETMLPEVSAFSERVEMRLQLARAELEAALAAAAAAVGPAREAEAGIGARGDLAAAARALAEARRMSTDACSYPRATELAREAAATGAARSRAGGAEAQRP